MLNNDILRSYSQKLISDLLCTFITWMTFGPVYIQRWSLLTGGLFGKIDYTIYYADTEELLTLLKNYFLNSLATPTSFIIFMTVQRF